MCIIIIKYMQCVCVNYCMPSVTSMALVFFPVNPRRMREGYRSRSVYLSVYLSVCLSVPR